MNDQDENPNSDGNPDEKRKGNYRNLRSFRAATVIYDATVSFCERFVDKKSRLRDQMVQAARSGRQNIAEGCRASQSSSQTELRLVSVARASLDELRLDYEDYLRHTGLNKWPKDSPEAIAVRNISRQLPKRLPVTAAQEAESTNPTIYNPMNYDHYDRSDRSGSVGSFVYERKLTILRKWRPGWFGV